MLSNIGKQIAFLRKEKGLKQYELATLSIIQLESLNRIEAGEEIPSVPALMRIATALGITLEELLGEKEE
jgi:transcriptional regulator with XRE-family HTH domain